jgi:hypothetical protein
MRKMKAEKYIIAILVVAFLATFGLLVAVLQSNQQSVTNASYPVQQDVVQEREGISNDSVDISFPSEEEMNNLLKKK